MEKLLILGNNNKTDVLIKVAKARGIYTILTDNLPAENSTFKKLVDEAWDISIYDVDEIVKKATEEGVTGVTSGASEPCMAAVREICKRMNLPFYVSDKAWEITNDKRKFKEACQKHGIPVAKEFKLDINFAKEDLENITYPVIVKPTDGCSSIGLHLCKNQEELIAGYKDAYEKSKSHTVLVEKFYSGAEISLLFTFYNGEATLTEAGDTFGYKIEGLPFVFGYGPSVYKEKMCEEIVPNLKKLFKDMECNSGVGLVQIIKGDQDEYAVTEMNYRLPGGNSPSQDYICECVMDAVMSQNVFETLPPFEQPLAPGYLAWITPGTIGSIEGIEEIKEIPGVVTVFQHLKVGDTVQPNSGMRQIFGIIIMHGDVDLLRENARRVNEILSVRDVNGNDMLRRFELDDNFQVIKK